MKAAGVILAIFVALVLQTTMTRFLVRGTLAVDLVLVVVVYVALTLGPEVGLLSGALAGLAQDALSSGIIGIGGLAKTVVGFLAGLVGTQFIVTQSLFRFVVFFGASVVQAVIFMGLYTLLDLRHFGSPSRPIAWQGLGNAIVGIVAFQIVEILPGAVERRRAAKHRLRR